jgi:hypothetical protein
MRWDRKYTQRRIYDNGQHPHVTATDVVNWIDESLRQQCTLKGSSLWEACVDEKMLVHGAQVERTGTGFMLTPAVWVVTKSIEAAVLLMEALLQGKKPEKDRYKEVLAFSPWEVMLDAETRGAVHTGRDMHLSMGKLVLREAGQPSQKVVGFEEAVHWHEQVGRMEMHDAGFLAATSPETVQESEWARIGASLACMVPTHGEALQCHVCERTGLGAPVPGADAPCCFECLGLATAAGQAGVVWLEDPKHKVICEIGPCTACGKAKVTCAKGNPQQGAGGIKKCATCWLNDARTMPKPTPDPIHARLFKATVAALKAAQEECGSVDKLLEGMEVEEEDKEGAAAAKNKEDVAASRAKIQEYLAAGNLRVAGQERSTLSKLLKGAEDRKERLKVVDEEIRAASAALQEECGRVEKLLAEEDMEVEEEDKEGAAAAKSREDVAASQAKIQECLAADNLRGAGQERATLSRLLTGAEDRKDRLKVVDEAIRAASAALQKRKKDAEQAQKKREEAAVFADNAILNCREWLKKGDRLQAREAYVQAAKHREEAGVDRTDALKTLLKSVEEADTRAGWATTAATAVKAAESSLQVGELVEARRQLGQAAAGFINAGKDQGAELATLEERIQTAEAEASTRLIQKQAVDAATAAAKAARDMLNGGDEAGAGEAHSRAMAGMEKVGMECLGQAARAELAGLGQEIAAATAATAVRSARACVAHGDLEGAKSLLQQAVSSAGKAGNSDDPELERVASLIRSAETESAARLQLKQEEDAARQEDATRAAGENAERQRLQTEIDLERTVAEEKAAEELGLVHQAIATEEFDVAREALARARDHWMTVGLDADRELDLGKIGTVIDEAERDAAAAGTRVETEIDRIDAAEEGADAVETGMEEERPAAAGKETEDGEIRDMETGGEEGERGHSATPGKRRAAESAPEPGPDGKQAPSAPAEPKSPSKSPAKTKRRQAPKPDFH